MCDLYDFYEIKSSIYVYMKFVLFKALLLVCIVGKCFFKKMKAHFLV